MDFAGDGVAAARLTGQWLGERRTHSVVEVVAHLLAVQAQDLHGARLAIRARADGLVSRDVDAALDSGRVVVTWLNRGTLHLVAAEDYWWLHALTATRTMTSNARRLRQEGVSPDQAERGIAVAVEAIGSDGPQTRQRLRNRLAAAGIPTAGQALVHVLMAASLRGQIVRGPLRDGEQAYALVQEWLGPPPAPLDRDAALHRLAERYLRGHHPADAGDLAAWAGITLGDARRGMDLAAGGSRPRDPEARIPPARLLGPFDPVLHGWPERGWVLGPYRQMVTVNGLFRPVVLVEGRAVGTWRRPRATVSLDLFESLDPAKLAQVDGEVADVRRFLGP